MPKSRPISSGCGATRICHRLGAKERDNGERVREAFIDLMLAAFDLVRQGPLW